MWPQTGATPLLIHKAGRGSWLPWGTSPVLLCGRRQRKKMLPRPNLGSSLPVTGKEEGGGSACSLRLLQTSTAAILQEHAP